MEFKELLEKAAFAAEHDKEIQSSRIGGFGGSDAKLFLNIASKGLDNLSQTELKRISIAMGLSEPDPHFENKYTRAGHTFEDSVEPYFTTLNPDIKREHKLEATADFFATNFKIFAHADFYDESIKKVSELKYVQKSDDETIKEYHAQFNWYYMLGVNAVELVHGQGDVEPFLIKDVNTIDIAKDPKTVSDLMRGVMILDQAISEGWQPTLKDADLLPTDIENALHLLFELDVEKKRITKNYDLNKEVIRKFMLGNGDGKYQIEHEGKMRCVTLTADTKKREFNLDKFIADHPQFDYKQYLVDHPEEDLEKYYDEKVTSGRFTIK